MVLKTYLIAGDGLVKARLEELFGSENTLEVLDDRVWFVRSELTATEEVQRKLVESTQPFHHIVVNVEYFAGYGYSSVLETLQAWGMR